MRKLASVRKVGKILPIKGADRIELAQVDGWFCIVKKGEFQVGDLGIYFEIDSLLPYSEPFLFLGEPKVYNKVKRYRLRTMKMRNTISQGLLLPLSYFSEIEKVSVGEDVTDLLKITKYEPTYSTEKNTTSRASMSKPFPTFIPKTNQERIQNIIHYFDVYKDMEFEETLKLDGSSITIFKTQLPLPWYKRIVNKVYPLFSANHFVVCSRNVELKDESWKPYQEMSNFWKVVHNYNLKEILPVGYAIQGELIAPNIQSNHEKVTKPDLYIFNVFHIGLQQFLLPKERVEFVNKLGLKHIPILGNIKIFNEVEDLEGLLKRVEGQSLNPNTISEGRVYKSVTSNMSFKVISNKYLLKKK